MIISGKLPHSDYFWCYEVCHLYQFFFFNANVIWPHCWIRVGGFILKPYRYIIGRILIIMLFFFRLS